MADEVVENISDSEKLGKIALKLFAFLQRCRIAVSVEAGKSSLFSWDFNCTDITDSGQPYGLAFTIGLNDVEKVENTEISIEKFCYSYVINVGTALLTEKATRLLEFNVPDSAKSRIILP